jgi:hypothetical protein
MSPDKGKTPVRNIGDAKDGASALPECFVIMPITDPEGYTPGHFRRVYLDIISPACEAAGFKAIRADDVKQTNLIHLDVLQKLLNCPMVVCDLSSHNPNVLFELALRQAFDKPVALIQEAGTKRIFDISPLRAIGYRKERIYDEVLEDQKSISIAINETHSAHGKGPDVNSIVKLLALTGPASLPESKSPDMDLMRIMIAEIGQLQNEVRNLSRRMRPVAEIPPLPKVALEVYKSKELDIKTRLDRLANFLERPDPNLSIIESELISCHKLAEELKESADYSQILKRLDDAYTNLITSRP